MAIERSDVIEYLSNLTVMDISALVKELEEKWGVKAASGGGMMMMAAAAPVATEAVEEQTEFTVVLESFGDKKIEAIKVVREITGLGLKEAKDLVEGVPANVKEGIAKDEAEKARDKLVAVGCTAKIK